MRAFCQQCCCAETRALISQSATTSEPPKGSLAAATRCRLRRMSHSTCLAVRANQTRTFASQMFASRRRFYECLRRATCTHRSECCVYASQAAFAYKQKITASILFLEHLFIASSLFSRLLLRRSHLLSLSLLLASTRLRELRARDSLGDEPKLSHSQALP